MKKISIIGFGRFGKTLYRLIKNDFDIVIYSRSVIDKKDFNSNTKLAKSLKEVYQSKVIFYCVPIPVFENVIKEHKKYLRENHLLIDVLSVKVHAQKVFTKYLSGTKTKALLTHPMFGPDSSKNGFEGLPFIIDKFLATKEQYSFWKQYLQKKNLNIIEMSAKTHDKLAASSQGLTHFIGRLLEEYKFKPTIIDSLGSKKLQEVVEQTCNDTWELFYGLQQYNPYTKTMRLKLGSSYDKLYNKLLPKSVKKGKVVFGIQGGKGSFNEEALNYYLKRNKINNYIIKYLYTSENVLKALHKGEIDFGQFAIHNSVGGIVGESIEALAKYKIKIKEQFAIKISHALMIRKDAIMKDVTIIMTHPQVLAQCKNTLFRKYPKLKKTSGKKELVDHALVAKKMSEKKIAKNIATMGSKILTEIYDLKIVEDNLQDAKENYTSFLLAERI